MTNLKAKFYISQYAQSIMGKKLAVWVFILLVSLAVIIFAFFSYSSTSFGEGDSSREAVSISNILDLKNKDALILVYTLFVLCIIAILALLLHISYSMRTFKESESADKNSQLSVPNKKISKSRKR